MITVFRIRVYAICGNALNAYATSGSAIRLKSIPSRLPSLRYAPLGLLFASGLSPPVSSHWPLATSHWPLSSGLRDKMPAEQAVIVGQMR